MLEMKMKKWLVDQQQKAGGAKTIRLYQEENQYVEAHRIAPEGVNIEERNAKDRFTDAYIERGDKETGEFLGEESADFLQQSIDYFNVHKNEFMYMESTYFELVGVDAVSFEVDDVFGTYSVMFGLKLQKKFAPAITAFFEKELNNIDAKFELLFDGNEGIWNVNLCLNDVVGFEEGMKLETAFGLIYRFLFRLAESV